MALTDFLFSINPLLCNMYVSICKINKFVCLHYHEIITFLDNCFIIRKSGIFIEGCQKLIYSAINKGVLCQRLRGIPKMADHLLTDYKSIQCSQIMALKFLHLFMSL